MKITTKKFGTKSKRFAAFALAAAMSFGAVGTDFYSNVADMFGANEQSINMSVSAAELVSGQTYYDSGTMWLQAYYSEGTEGDVITGDATSEKTNGKYKFDASHYHQTDGWLTLDVESALGEDAVTLPGTTDIEEVDAGNVMSCWREYVGHLNGENTETNNIYGINVVDFSTPPASGDAYNYIAKGVSSLEDCDGDGVDEVKITWQIRAWPEEGTLPDTSAEIKAEWDNIDSDITADISNKGETVYESDFYEVYIPEWLSDNKWYTDFIKNGDNGITIDYDDWTATNGASYNNSCKLTISGLTPANIGKAVNEGDSKKFVANSMTSMQFFMYNRDLDEDTEIFVRIPVVFENYSDYNGTTFDSSVPAPTKTVEANNVQFHYYPTYAPDAMPDIFERLLSSIYTDAICPYYASLDPDGTPISESDWLLDMGIREYMFYLTADTTDADTADDIYALKSYDEIMSSPYSLVYADYHNKNSAYFENTAKFEALHSRLASNPVGSDEYNAAKAEYDALEKIEALNITLLYDVTYDMQRAGGDYEGYIEQDTDCSITTELTNNATANHYATAAADVDLTEVVSYTFTGENYPGTYRADAELYVLGSDGTVSGTPLASATSGEFTLTAGSGLTGNVDVEFNDIDASELDGKTIVAYAELYSISNGNETLVAEHKEAADKDEQVTFTNSYVDTTLLSVDTDTHLVPNGENVSVRDTVTATGLIPGVDYYAVGYLAKADADNENGYTLIPISNKNAVSNKITTEDKTASADGTIEFTIDYTFNSIENPYAVACVELMMRDTSGNSSIAKVHVDLKNDDQTVYTPSIETDASNTATLSQQGIISPTDTIVDTITYANIVPGLEYTIKGYIYDTADTTTAIATAVAEFTPTGANGTYDITFDDIDASALNGKTIVVYEEIYYGDVLIAYHKDVNDTRQMVYYPSIGTSAKDGETDTQVGTISSEAVINDTVHYTNLIPGKSYELKGKLMTVDKNGDAIAVKDADGKEITATKTFTPETADGDVVVTFTFDATVNNYTKVVVFEDLYYDGQLIATHSDITDESQTIVYNSDITIDTIALDKANGTHVASASKDTIITDEITITGLTIGESYTVEGKIVNADGTELVDANDKPVVMSSTFTAETTTHKLTLEYAYDYSNMSGKTVVATATLSHNGETVSYHAALDDADQTISFPAIKTVASSGLNSDSKLINPVENAVIVDKIELTGLVSDTEYKVEGKLYNKTDSAFITLDNKDVIATVVVTADENGNAETSMTFEGVDFSNYVNDDIVVYQYLYQDDVLVASDANIDNADETVHVSSNPEVKTVLAETTTGNKVLAVNEDVKLNDTAEYINLAVGTNYVAVSKLIAKDTGKVITIGDKELVNEVAFTASAETSSQAIPFEFNSADMDGKSIVAYNYLYTVVDGQRILVASEEDINNLDQTIEFPSIDTEASDAATGDKTLIKDKKAVINDRVDYTGLEVGKTYTLTLTVYDKETGKALEGVAPVVHTFEPTESTGYEIVSVEVDTTLLGGKKLVMFESLKEGERELAVHADIEDEDQTVEVPTIDTLLTSTDGGQKTVNMGEVVKLTDTITYTGLTPGVTYVISGQIIDKETRLGIEPELEESAEDTENLDTEDDETLVVGTGSVTNQTQNTNQSTATQNATDIIATATVEFTPTEANGTASVEFEVNTSNLNGHHLVAFQTVVEKESSKLIMEHADLEDEDQTVLVKTTTTVDTGIENFTTIFAIVSVSLLGAFAGLAGFIVYKKKRESKN